VSYGRRVYSRLTSGLMGLPRQGQRPDTCQIPSGVSARTDGLRRSCTCVARCSIPAESSRLGDHAEIMWRSCDLPDERVEPRGESESSRRELSMGAELRGGGGGAAEESPLGWRGGRVLARHPSRRLRGV